MTYRIMELGAIGPGLLCVNDAGPISSIPFATEGDARAAAVAYGGEEALAKGQLVILEEEDEEGGFRVW
jgi:hypothetical protein